MNRFAYDYHYDENVKIYDYFEFYEEIDLSSYIHDDSDDSKYELLAVYVHFGLRGNYGHYKVYMKIEDQWYEFNDEIVQKTNWSHV